jgi:hypothetical protein
MIKKILSRKTRNGILSFFLGIIIVVGSLYSDVIRGDASGTIGLYQVVGALTGYMLAIIGILLVVKQTKPRKSIQNSFLYGGGIIVAVSIFADHIGIAGAAGFDNFQWIGIFVGAIILATGIFVRPQIISMTLATLDTSDSDE